VFSPSQVNTLPRDAYAAAVASLPHSSPAAARFLRRKIIMLALRRTIVAKAREEKARQTKALEANGECAPTKHGNSDFLKRFGEDANMLCARPSQMAAAFGGKHSPVLAPASARPAHPIMKRAATVNLSRRVKTDEEATQRSIKSMALALKLGDLLHAPLEIKDGERAPDEANKQRRGSTIPPSPHFEPGAANEMVELLREMRAGMQRLEHDVRDLRGQMGEMQRRLPPAPHGAPPALPAPPAPSAASSSPRGNGKSCEGSVIQVQDYQHRGSTLGNSLPPLSANATQSPAAAYDPSHFVRVAPTLAARDEGDNPAAQPTVPEWRGNLRGASPAPGE
jgi:hypothetical protein